MPYRDYPSKGEIRGEKGLKLAGYLAQVGPDHLSGASDLYFYQDSLRRRRGFTRLSTEDWSAELFGGAVEYVDDAGNSRLLVAQQDGTVKEIQSDSASASVITGLGADRTCRFAAAFGSLFMVNGDDTLRRIDATSNPATAVTARQGGKPAKVEGFGAAAGSAGARTGSYVFMATAVIESGGVKLLESDWTALEELSLSSEAATFSWTDPSVADDRVTHVYLYGSKVGGDTLYFIRKVALAATGYTDDDTADTALGAVAPLLAKNVAPPAAPELVEFSGSRLVLAKGRTMYISPRGLNAYDVEGFPTTLEAPLAGPITALKAIGNPGGTYGANSLFIGQDRAVHILFQTDPTQPITTLSTETGVWNADAVAVRGRWLFWVDRKRGVMFWPGEGAEIYAISEKVNPIFEGGGYQTLTANSGDANVALSVWRDMLLVTVRDDATHDGPNKVYAMDLRRFERSLFRAGPVEAARWIGPWSGIGFHRIIPRADRSLTVIDNENREILTWDETTFSDYVDGSNVEVFPVVRSGICLAETRQENHMLKGLQLYAYANEDSSLRIIGEEGRFDQPAIVLEPISYANIPVLDIPLLDIAVLSDSFKSQPQDGIEWGLVAEWFSFEFSTADATNDWIFMGFRFQYVSRRILRNYP